jgi:ATP-dependent Lon protease
MPIGDPMGSMLSARNRRDFEDIPENARDRLEFVWLEHVDDAIAVALEDWPEMAATAE